MSLICVSDDQTYRFPFASYPAIRLVLLVITGIIMDYLVNPPPLLWLSLLFLSVAVYNFCEYQHALTLHAHRYRPLITWYLWSLVTFGGTWHALLDNRDRPPEAQVMETYVWEELQFSGRIYHTASTATGNVYLDIAVDTTFFPTNLNSSANFLNNAGDKPLEWTRSYNLRALLDSDHATDPSDLKPGRRISFSARLYPLQLPRNPHEFDYQSYLASQNIYVRGGITAITFLAEPRGILPDWIFIRQKVQEAIDQSFSESSAPLAKALLTGSKDELGRDVRISFSRAGLSHIMAVSGLHVGFLLVPFWFIIPYFWTLRYGKQFGLCLLVLLLFFYTGITGFSASVTRASLGGGLLVYARLFHKVRDSKNLMAVAALVILLISPSDLFAIGFQLSFTAVYIILLLLPVLNHYLPEWLFERWYGKVLTVMVISLLVQAGLFPLLTFYFGEFSLIGPLTNALVVPFLGVVLPFALILLPVALCFPGLARTVATPADIFFSGLSTLAEGSARLSWSWIPVHTESLLLMVIWASAILFLAALPFPRRRWKLLALLLALICLHQGRGLMQKLQPAKLEVTIFDVGQGDATLIKTPLGRHFLIDTGRWQPGYSSARSILIPHLKAEGIRKLEGIFLSHPHADHIGGILDLMKQIPVDTIYHSGAEYDSDLYASYHSLAQQKMIPVKSLSPGQQVRIDPSLRLLIYGPAPQSRHTYNVNNQSLVLEIIYGTTEFLFMGDAEAPQESRLSENFHRFADTDFLKVPHHGSNSSSTSLFLLQSTPDIAVISVGKPNRFNHPHPQAIKRLRKTGADVYFTSLQGALIFESDGQMITSKTWR